MPILTTPCATATSLNSGFELGKLAPTRTVSTDPLTESVTAPVFASVRACDGLPLSLTEAVLGGPAVITPAAAAAVPGELDPGDPPVAVVVLTCWTNGSLPANEVNERSCDFDTFGVRSESGSFVLPVVGSEAAAAVPGAVVAGAVGAPLGAVVGVVAVVAAGGVELLLPPCLRTFGISKARMATSR